MRYEKDFETYGSSVCRSEIGKLSNSARVFFLVESTRFCIKKKSCQLLLSEIGKLYRLMGFADNFSYGERTL